MVNLDLHTEAIIAALADSAYRSRFKENRVKHTDFFAASHRWLVEKYFPIIGGDEATLGTIKEALRLESFANDRKKEIYRDCKDLLSEISTRIEEGYVSGVHPDFTFNVLSKLRRQNALEEVSRDVLERIEAGEDPDSIFENFKKKYADASDAFEDPQGEIYKISNPLEDLDARLGKRREVVATGRRIKFDHNPELHEFFPLGINEGEQLLVLGPTNVGKSFLAQDILIHAFLHNGLNVAFCVTENEESLNNARFDAQINDVPYTDMYEGTLDAEKVREISDKYKAWEADSNIGSVRFVKLVPKRFTAVHIDRALSDIEAEIGEAVDVLIIDSPEHMLPIHEKKSFHEDKAEVYYDLKTLVSLRKLIGVYTVQRKRDGSSLFKRRKDEEKLMPPSPEEAAGSIEIPRIADHIIAMSPPTPLDIMKKRVKVWLCKARNSPIPEMPVLVYRDPVSLKLTWDRLVSTKRGFSIKKDKGDSDGGE